MVAFSCDWSKIGDAEKEGEAEKATVIELIIKVGYMTQRFSTYVTTNK